MSTIIKKWLKCDRCGHCLGEFDTIQKKFGRDGIYMEQHSIGWQRAVARHHGWRRSSGLDYCGECAECVFTPNGKERGTG